MSDPNSTTTPRLCTPSPLELRSEVHELVVKELHGPAGGIDEEITEAITDRYLVGMMAPRETVVGADQDDELADAGEESSEEGSAERSGVRVGSMFPSSLGLSFVLDGAVDRVRACGKWGRYRREKSETELTEKGNPKTVWRRHQCGGDWVEVPIADGRIAPMVLDPAEQDMKLRGVARRLGDQWVVTLFVVNDLEEPSERRGEAWAFQVELEVRGVDDAAVFRRRPVRRSNLGEPALLHEEEEMAMANRHEGEFAVGHGVAVHAEVDPQDAWRATSVRTQVMPSYEVERMDPPTAEDPGFEWLAGMELDMQVYAESDDPASLLEPLVENYERWIDAQSAKVGDPQERLGDYQEAAERVADKARRALDRLREGLELLRSNENARRAFAFANRAMHLQRVRSIYAEAVRKGESPDLAAIEAEPRNHSWRPFQLAFVLLNLASSTDLHHADRSDPTEAVADLLWFPTGGGKTEAYLGLAAYVLGLRRLEGEIEGHDGQHGVAVLMRYTLRLLTLQQFQRATALICACETIRRGDPGTWGEAIFRIGIWVGGRTTPNWTKDAHAWIESERAGDGARYHGSVGGSGSPHQLTNCPWCGSKFDPGRDLIGDGVRKRTLTVCPNRDCDFSSGKSPKEGLPIVVVDEEVYRLLPSLLIATVDKFAQMPWNGRTQMLFGHVDSFCPRHGFRTSDVEDKDRHPARQGQPAVSSQPCGPLRPPDLIIQDELHLISGPLGSMVGLYETAVDALCTWVVGGQKVRPKVVASTATTRNSAHQVRSLFLRRVEVFPPQGMDAADNFFSIRRASSDRAPGRLYLGICAPGKRLKVALIRVYLAHLAAAQLLYDRHGKHADAWMTLVGYFNSIRELGGMMRLVEDDVGNRLIRMQQHGLARRRRPIAKELTSRMGATDIPEVLDHLEAVFDPALEQRRDEERKNKAKLTSKRPIDVLLATNMISVGVDVARLGCMVVGGQPKSTAEYIQATSRVGRRHPGIVTTVYNWSRPRDLSHYERFEHYHATFYAQVEALSVTPFAARALDRGLAALLVACVRLRSRELNGNDTARSLTPGHQLIGFAVEDVRSRVADVLSDARLGDRVAERCRAIADQWLREAKERPTLTYKRASGDSVALLSAPEEEAWHTFTCLNSLRDVEPSPALVLLENGTRTRESIGDAD